MLENLVVSLKNVMAGEDLGEKVALVGKLAFSTVRFAREKSARR